MTALAFLALLLIYFVVPASSVGAQQPPFAARRNVNGRHHVPIVVRLPTWIREPPDSQTWREIVDLHVPRASVDHWWDVGVGAMPSQASRHRLGPIVGPKQTNSLLVFSTLTT